MKRENRKHAIICLIFLLIFDVAAIAVYAVSQSDNRKSEKEQRIEKTAKENEKYTAEDVQNTATSKRKKDDDILVLVNKKKAIPKEFHPQLHRLKNGKYVAEVMYEDLKAMWSDCEADNPGYSILVVSAYRTAARQTQILQEEIRKNRNAGMSEEQAEKDALQTVAPSGYSEHETGLCVDITSKANQRLDQTQETTSENIWLRKHCAEYGFILRYPKGKEKVTGYDYESWHFRYVGKEAAKEITSWGLTLEEYVSTLRR